VVPQGAHALPELMERLRKAPRRRDFKTVPMILDHPDLWDDTALKEVIAYRTTTKQVWDNTDIAISCAIRSMRRCSPSGIATS
jgi:hypothetical protein